MLKYEKEKEKAAFKKMTFREKLTHINNYYRLPIVIGIIAILIGAWALDHYVIHPPKKPSLAIVTASSENVNLETEEFQQKLNELLPELCTDRQEIQVSAMIMKDDEYQTAYYNAQKFMALVAAKSIDVVIGNEDVMKQYAESEYFYNLDEFFTEEEREGLEIISCEVTVEYDTLGRPIKNEGPYPLLIRIGTPELFQSEFGTNQELYVGIIANSPNPESVKKFVEFLKELQ